MPLSTKQRQVPQLPRLQPNGKLDSARVTACGKLVPLATSISIFSLAKRNLGMI